MTSTNKNWDYYPYLKVLFDSNEVYFRWDISKWICSSIYLYIYIYIYLSIYLSICMSINEILFYFKKRYIYIYKKKMNKWMNSLTKQISKSNISKSWNLHCRKDIQNRSFSGPYFLALGIHIESKYWKTWTRKIWTLFTPCWWQVLATLDKKQQEKFLKRNSNLYKVLIKSTIDYYVSISKYLLIFIDSFSSFSNFLFSFAS